jgi:hypothetical protein
MKITVFWDLTPSIVVILVDVLECYYPHLESRRVKMEPI